jgi:hypothetical protein
LFTEGKGRENRDELWGSGVLNQESGKLGLGDDGELGISAADIPFPVRVLRGVGC